MRTGTNSDNKSIASRACALRTGGDVGRIGDGDTDDDDDDDDDDCDDDTEDTGVIDIANFVVALSCLL